MAVWLDADDAPEAQDKAMNLLDPGAGVQTYYSTEAGPAQELNPEEAAAHWDFQKTLDQAIADAGAGLTVTDDRHPGVVFSPAAAATLMALEAESSSRKHDD